MLRDHYLPWCSCYWDHPSTLSSGLLLSAFLALAFPCPPVIFAWGKYDYARQPLVCSHFACGVMSELPAVYSRIFISYLLLTFSAMVSPVPIQHMTFYVLCPIMFSFSHLWPCIWFSPCLEVTTLPISQLDTSISPLRKRIDITPLGIFPDILSSFHSRLD